MHDRPVTTAAAGQRVAVNLAAWRSVKSRAAMCSSGGFRDRAHVPDRRRARARGARTSAAPASRSTTAPARRRPGSPGSAAASGSCASSSRWSRPPGTAWSSARSPRRTRSAAGVLDGHPHRTARAGRPSPPRAASRAGSGSRTTSDRTSTRRLGNRTAAPASTAPPSGLGALARPNNACATPGSSPRSTPSSIDADLAALRAAGRAVRVSRTLHYHRDALAEARARIVALAGEPGGSRSHSRHSAMSSAPRASSPRRCSSTSTPSG